MASSIEVQVVVNKSQALKEIAEIKAALDQLKTGINIGTGSGSSSGAFRNIQKDADDTIVKIERVQEKFYNLKASVEKKSSNYADGLFTTISKQIDDTIAKLQDLNSQVSAFSGGKISKKEADGFASQLKDINKEYQDIKTSVSKVTSENEKMESSGKKAGNTLTSSFKKANIESMIFYRTLSLIRNAFREAFDTMKEVDSELANIQKVTDRTDAEMEKTANSAYSVASAYGVEANAYLESVAEFAKAGYGDKAETLGELAIKTQLVGDVSADVADKFLLATDAAWKFEGSQEELSRVLDEANTIENNYATSIEKLAEGMPNVASVASMVGMSVEETMAALGTITATTQESGSRASRALRALILNIMGDTTTEVEEGVTVTTEQIETLSDVIWKYAGDTMRAAQATGELVNPMEVIAALSQAMKDNALTDTDLAKIETALGGKLRTNELNALLSGFDMYNEMLGMLGESAGSADREIGIMLDTWESKANILKNTWTEVVQNTINSDLIKWFLDAATAVLEFSDNLLNLVGMFGGLAAAINANKIADFISDLGVGSKAAEKASDALEEVGESAEEASKSTNNLASSIATMGIVISLATALASGVAKIINSIQDSYDETAKAASENAEETAATADEYLNLGIAYNAAAEGSEEYQNASKGIASSLDTEADKVDNLIGKYDELTEAKIQEAEKSAWVAYTTAKDSFENLMLYGGTNNNFSLTDMKKMGSTPEVLENIESILEKYNRGGSFDGSLQILPKDADEAIAFYEDLLAIQKQIEDDAYRRGDESALSSSFYKDITESINYYAESYGNLTSEYDNWVKSTVRDDVYKKIKEVGKNSIDTKEEYDELLESFNDGIRSEDELKAITEILEDAFPSLSNEVENTTGKVDGLTDALNKAKDAAKALSDGTGEYDDELNDFASGLDDMLTAGSESKFNSNAWKNGLNSMFNSDWVESFGGDNKKLYQEVQEWGEVLKDPTKLMEKMSDYTNKTEDGVKKIVEDGRELASFWTESDGTWGFKISDDPEDREMLSKITGLADLGMLDIQLALAMYSGDIDVDALLAMIEAKKAGIDVEVTTSGAEEAKGELDSVTDAAKEAAESDPTVEVEVETTVTANADDDEVNETAEAIELIKDKEIKIEVNNSQALTAIAAVRKSLEQVKSKKVTVTTEHVDTYTTKTKKNARGTDNFEGGLTMVNEQAGGYNPELIVDNGEAFIAGGGEPTIVNLSKGAQIYNARDTREILGGESRTKDFAVGAYASGTGIPSSKKISTPSGNSGTKSNSSGSSASSTATEDAAWWKQLKEYVSELQEDAEEILDTETEKLEEQIEILKKEKELKEEEDKLEEKKKAVLEAQNDLLDAQTNKTVRYFNKITGQWEWMADAQTVADAEEALAEAEKDLQDYLDDQAYEAQIDALEGQIDALKEHYDNLEDLWSDISDEIQDFLDGMNNLNITSILSQMASSNAKSEKSGLEEWMAALSAFIENPTGSYDNGGIASGKGLLRKAVKANEVVLGTSLASKVLSPTSNAQFSNFTDALAKMFNVASVGSKMVSSKSSSVTNNNGGNTYINGIKIGQDMADKPLSEILSVLPIYSN